MESIQLIFLRSEKLKDTSSAKSLFIILRYMCTVYDPGFPTILSEKKASDVHEVVQLHMLNWSPDGSCSNLNTITSVIREMIDIQMKTGNHSIVVHCRCDLV